MTWLFSREAASLTLCCFCGSAPTKRSSAESTSWRMPSSGRSVLSMPRLRDADRQGYVALTGLDPVERLRQGGLHVELAPFLARLGDLDGAVGPGQRGILRLLGQLAGHTAGYVTAASPGRDGPESARPVRR